MRRGMAAGLVFMFMTGAAHGQDIASVRRELVDELETLADWCTKKKLLRTRNRLYETILRFEPDHAEARSWLRFEKTPSGWVRTRRYREPRDFRPEALPAFNRRRDEIAQRLRQRLWPAVEAGGMGKARALEVLLTLDPNDRRLREANGEVKYVGGWVLAETVTAFKRREQLQRLAGSALRAAPAPSKDRPTAEEKRLGVRWKCAYQGQWWRIVASTPAADARRTLRVIDASPTFLNAALPDAARPVTPEGMRAHGYQLYYLSSTWEGTQLLARHPKVDARYRKFASRLKGAWIPGTRTDVIWGDDETGRHDSACRSSVATVLRRRYGRFKQGWITEGFGMYLSYYLVGTRLTTFVTRTKYASERDRLRKLDLWRRMSERGANWLDLARDMHERDRPPDLRFLVTLNVNQMSVEDLVHAYSMAAYLIEGRPDGVSKFLAKSIDGGFDEALSAAYGTTVPEFAARLARWLKETP